MGRLPSHASPRAPAHRSRGTSPASAIRSPSGRRDGSRSLVDAPNALSARDSGALPGQSCRSGLREVLSTAVRATRRDGRATCRLAQAGVRSRPARRRKAGCSGCPLRPTRLFSPPEAIARLCPEPRGRDPKPVMPAIVAAAPMTTSISAGARSRDPLIFAIIISIAADSRHGMSIPSHVARQSE